MSAQKYGGFDQKSTLTFSIFYPILLYGVKMSLNFHKNNFRREEGTQAQGGVTLQRKENHGKQHFKVFLDFPETPTGGKACGGRPCIVL